MGPLCDDDIAVFAAFFAVTVSYQACDSSKLAHTFRQYNWLLTSSGSFFRHLIVTNLKIEKK